MSNGKAQLSKAISETLTKGPLLRGCGQFVLVFKIQPTVLSKFSELHGNTLTEDTVSEPQPYCLQASAILRLTFSTPKGRREIRAKVSPGRFPKFYHLSQKQGFRLLLHSY